MQNGRIARPKTFFSYTPFCLSHAFVYSFCNYSSFTFQAKQTLAAECTEKEIKVLKDEVRALHVSIYSRCSRKRPPREFRKVVATRAGRLREWAVVSDHIMKQ